MGRGATSVGQPCGRLDDDRSSLDDDDGGGESAAGKGPEGGPPPARTPAGKPPPPQRVCGLGIGQDWAKAPASGPGHSEGVRGRVPRRPARATRTLARPPRGASAPPPQRTCRCRMRTSGAWGASRSKPRPAGFGATCKGSLPKPTGVYPEDEQRGRVRRASGEGGAEGTASGVPQEAFQPGDLAFPQISAPHARPSPPVFTLRKHSTGRQQSRKPLS